MPISSPLVSLDILFPLPQKSDIQLLSLPHTDWQTSFCYLSPEAWLEYYSLINLLYSTSSWICIGYWKLCRRWVFGNWTSFLWWKPTTLVPNHSCCCCCTTTSDDKTATQHSSVLLPSHTAQQKRHMLRAAALSCPLTPHHNIITRISGH